MRLQKEQRKKRAAYEVSERGGCPRRQELSPSLTRLVEPSDSPWADRCRRLGLRGGLPGRIEGQRSGRLLVLNGVFIVTEANVTTPRCGALHRLLKDFVATELASAAGLVYPGTAPVTVREGAAILAIAVPPADDQIAHFGFDQKGQPYYVCARLTGSSC